MENRIVFTNKKPRDRARCAKRRARKHVLRRRLGSGTRPGVGRDTCSPCRHPLPHIWGMQYAQVSKATYSVRTRDLLGWQKRHMLTLSASIPPHLRYADSCLENIFYTENTFCIPRYAEGKTGAYNRHPKHHACAQWQRAGDLCIHTHTHTYIYKYTRWLYMSRRPVHVYIDR